MEIRRLPIGQGIAWFRQAANLGASNPRAVFGAALLLIATLYAVMFVAMLPMIARLQHQEIGSIQSLLKWMVPFFLVVMWLTPVLIGGLMHVIRESESGRPARARDVYIAFRAGKAWRLASLGLVQIGFGILGGMLVTVLAGQNYWHDYMAAMQAAMSGSVPVMPEPQHPGLLLLTQLVFNYFSYAIMLLSIPLILFSGLSFGQAISASFRASLRNFFPYLFAGILFVLAMIVAVLMIMLAMVVAQVVGSFLHPAVGTALTLVLFFVFAAMVLVVLVGSAYLAWRDTFEAAVQAVGPADQLQA
ncbi:DUF898 domain-containing protein [Pseudoluteimonas lycopersici]|uniref:DUF898 domain-containing protein n=1 Tax=Pseudoluteimonas lycopersici TaxID=1324796 RepID=A0A516V6I8_9GAMM|nr:BPSS1780 family membrane protein [Lysobacter lycopersici]QDQ74135.1 DUF898 domain-containing protein [Lysobacter lycopersici]